MGDRRQGERREPEKSVFSIKKKDFFIGLFVACVIIVSGVVNICLAVININQRKLIEEYEDRLLAEYEDDEWEDIEYIDEIYDEEIEKIESEELEGNEE